MPATLIGCGVPMTRTPDFPRPEVMRSGHERADGARHLRVLRFDVVTWTRRNMVDSQPSGGEFEGGMRIASRPGSLQSEFSGNCGKGMRSGQDPTRDYRPASEDARIAGRWTTEPACSRQSEIAYGSTKFMSTPCVVTEIPHWTYTRVTQCKFDWLNLSVENPSPHIIRSLCGIVNKLSEVTSC
jgi:hypothetical protein